MGSAASPSGRGGSPGATCAPDRSYGAARIRATIDWSYESLRRAGGGIVQPAEAVAREAALRLINGTYRFTGANGDQLVADHTGFSALVGPGIVLITEHAVIDPNHSTGRFAGADGSFTVERLADAATGVGGRTVGLFGGTISPGGQTIITEVP